jgi:hypothetical protein
VKRGRPQTLLLARRRFDLLLASRGVARSLAGAFALLLLVLASSVAAAFTPPTQRGSVNDVANVLAPAERTALTARIAAYRARTTNEVVVLVLASLEGNSIEDVAYATFNGREGKASGSGGRTAGGGTVDGAPLYAKLK